MSGARVPRKYTLLRTNGSLPCFTRVLHRVAAGSWSRRRLCRRVARRPLCRCQVRVVAATCVSLQRSPGTGSQSRRRRWQPWTTARRTGALRQALRGRTPSWTETNGPSHRHQQRHTCVFQVVSVNQMQDQSNVAVRGSGISQREAVVVPHGSQLAIADAKLGHSVFERFDGCVKRCETKQVRLGCAPKFLCRGSFNCSAGQGRKKKILATG